MWVVLRTSFGVLFRIFLRTTDGILKFMGCCHAAVIGSGIFHFSQAQVYVFLLQAFAQFSFLAHFALTNFVSLCIKILFTEFQSSSNICPPFCLSKLNFVGAVNHFLISLFCTHFHLIALFTDLGLIDMFLSQSEFRCCCLYIIKPLITQQARFRTIAKLFSIGDPC